MKALKAFFGWTRNLSPSWHVLAISGVISAACVLPGLVCLESTVQASVLTFFQERLREPLFIGLLTVAAFLFSLKTFIIVTMKENVYETEAYEKRLQKLRQLDPSIRRYKPLEDFSLLLFLAVLLTMVSAVLQFTIGLIDMPWAAAICIDTAIWSIAIIFVSLIYMQLNLREWFSFLDEAE